MLVFSSQLVQDYLSSMDRASQFFNADISNSLYYGTIAQKVKRPLDPLVRELFLESIQTLPETHANRRFIPILSKPLCMVVTGQQPGLFGGPLYTLYKALSAVKLADHLSQQWQESVLPVFFVASEDHDYDEVKCTGLVNQKNQFQSLCLPDLAENRKPLASITLPQEVKELTAYFQQWLPGTEFKDDMLAQLEHCYAPGKTLSTAFVEWLSFLFADKGLLILDGADERLKSVAAPVLLKELRERTSLQTLPETNARLQKAGYDIQLFFQENRPALFHLAKGERHGLEWDPNAQKYIDLGSKRFIERDRLEDTKQLSPKAALRPLMQDTVLPTVAYVAGPGEIAYWAQLKGLYERMGITMPAVWPRASFTLLEPKIKRHLDRFELSANEVLEKPGEIVNEVVGEMIPEHIKEHFVTIKNQFDDIWSDLLRDVVQIEPTMETVLDKGKKGIFKQLDSIEGRLSKAIRNREQTVVQQLQSVVTHLAPGHHFQERQLGFVPFLVKFGPHFLESVYQEIDMSLSDHKTIEL